MKRIRLDRVSFTADRQHLIVDATLPDGAISGAVLPIQPTQHAIAMAVASLNPEHPAPYFTGIVDVEDAEWEKAKASRPSLEPEPVVESAPASVVAPAPASAAPSTPETDEPAADDASPATDTTNEAATAKTKAAK